jgi:hypothetical protein
MVRVTKENGWIVVLDTDWGSGGIDTTEIDIERRLARFMADHMYHNGYAGRQLFRQFKEQEFVNVSFEVFPLVVTNYTFARQIWSLDELEMQAVEMNVVTETEVKKIQTDFEKSDANGVFFGYGCLTLVAGQKVD